MQNLSRCAGWLAIGGLCYASGGAWAQSVVDSQELEQIIVRGARVPISASRSGSSVTLLEPAQLDPAGRPMAGDFLRSVPGVALSRAGGYGALTQLRMRGGEANHVAVFVDGVRVNDPSQSGEFDFAHLLADGIERIEVIRWPQSALWGSDALSGVINIVSARPQTGIHVNAAAESGSDEWRRIAGRVGGAAERGYFDVTAARVSTDGYNVSRTGDERDGYENSSIRFGAGYALTEGITLAVSLHSIDSVTQFDGTDFSTGLPVDRLNATDKQQFLGLVSLAAETLGGRWQHKLSMDRLDTENETRTENDFVPAQFDTAIAGAVVDTLLYQTDFALTDAHRLIAALEHRDESFRQRGPISFADPNRDERMKTSSVVLEYDGRLGTNFSLLASLRRDMNSEFEDAQTARLSVAYGFANEATRLRGAIGEGIKNPTFTERYGFFTDFLGNPELRPEHSRTWEIGVDHRFEEARLGLSATYFDETLDDEINGFVFDPVRGGFTAANEDGESLRNGVELEGDWRATDALSIGFAYTWLDAREPDPLAEGFGREVRRPGNTAGFRLRWIPRESPFDFGLRLDHSSSQDDFFFPPDPPFQERVTLAGFTLVSLSASWDLNPALSVFGRIDNAFAAAYEEVLGFRGADRQIFLGIRYDFDADR